MSAREPHVSAPASERTTPKAEAVTTRSGMPAWRYPAPDARGGVVVVSPSSWGGGAGPPRNAPPTSLRAGAATEGGEAASAPALPSELAALLDARFTVVVPDIAWRSEGVRGGEAPGADSAPRGDVDPAGPVEPDGPADPEAIAAIAEARDLLPAGLPRFVVGVGPGGLYARLAACALLGLDGVVAFGGRVRYAGVSARRPIQPLDLLPGLGCALQCHFDEADPEAPPGHVDELERRLAGVSRPWQVFRYRAGAARAGSSLAAEGAAGVDAWRGAAARTAWGRARAFLLHLAAERA